MESNNHIEALEELIERKRALDIKANSLINPKIKLCKKCKLNSQSKKNKCHESHQKTKSNNNSKQIHIENDSNRNSQSLKKSAIMTQRTIHKILSNIQDNADEVMKIRNDLLMKDPRNVSYIPRKRQRFKESTKKIKKSPDQIYNDLNRQSHSIKIRKYKDPRLVPEALKLPQSDVETLEYAEVQTPISMRFGGDKKYLDSKFEFYRAFMNSKLKRKFFNGWLSKWSRVEIKKLRNELKIAIVNKKDDIEEKKRFMRDFQPDNSLYYNQKTRKNDDEGAKQDTPVNMDTYNENFEKEQIIIDPEEEEIKRNEKYEPQVDYYIGGE